MVHEAGNTKKARLGILMLDTRFPRVPGDVGNAATWPFPVRFGVVAGATPQAIVCEDISPFVDAFVAKGKELVAEGCTGIATTCGFLAPIRPRLADALGVPVAASALEQFAQISANLPPGACVGILTISKTSLTAQHLEAAGVAPDAPIAGMEGTGFADAILNNRESLDVPAARAEMVAVAEGLVRAHPEVGAVLLECTNMPPYAPDIAHATGRPVFSIVSYLRWFQVGLLPPRFGD
ncbi:aspartate/glutamate racemase family protein [Marimonas sp. MJW-29]|uniref:Aspartate/glutamate racemase family protein n=1 Tax=Sulfitobacter sediminis TaxID=3234186 RepID=A0ABV3RM02_9RHOB